MVNNLMIAPDGFPDNWQRAPELRLLLEGPVGAIELLVNGIENPRALALICHPHPLHGGTLDNKVVFTLARACRDAGVVAVRFNFRGAGDSEGTHDNGVGELGDAKAVLSCLQRVLPGLPMILAGFSFGAAIVAQLAQVASCAGLLLVAPPVPRYGLGDVRLLTTPIMLLQCDDDDVVDSHLVYDWFNRLMAPQKTVQHWLQGGHFFHGMLPELKQASGQFFLSLLV